MNEEETPIIQPVQIKLSDGEIIKVDGVPYKGWGREPGKK